MASRDESIEYDSVLMEELGLLQAIYINELKVEEDQSQQPTMLILDLHPATGDDLKKRYVCMTLVLSLPHGYPDELPEICIRNPRGVGDEELQSLQEAMNELAESKQGGPMLFQLIEMAKETLTEGNIPRCPCVICLEHFEEGDVFTRTTCYHYFHEHCFGRYVKHAVAEAGNTEEECQVICPVCRENLCFDLEDISEFEDSSDEDDFKFKPSQKIEDLQKQMSELLLKQKSKGGVIDLQEEKDKYLVNADIVICLPSDDKGKHQNGNHSDVSRERNESDNSKSRYAVSRTNIDSKQLSQNRDRNWFKNKPKRDRRYVSYENTRKFCDRRYDADTQAGQSKSDRKIPGSRHVVDENYKINSQSKNNRERNRKKQDSIKYNYLGGDETSNEIKCSNESYSNSQQSLVKTEGEDKIVCLDQEQECEDSTVYKNTIKQNSSCIREKSKVDRHDSDKVEKNRYRNEKDGIAYDQYPSRVKMPYSVRGKYRSRHKGAQVWCDSSSKDYSFDIQQNSRSNRPRSGFYKSSVEKHDSKDERKDFRNDTSDTQISKNKFDSVLDRKPLKGTHKTMQESQRATIPRYNSGYHKQEPSERPHSRKERLAKSDRKESKMIGQNEGSKSFEDKTRCDKQRYIDEYEESNNEKHESANDKAESKTENLNSGYVNQISSNERYDATSSRHGSKNHSNNDIYRKNYKSRIERDYSKHNRNFRYYDNYDADIWDENYYRQRGGKQCNPIYKHKKNEKPDKCFKSDEKDNLSDNVLVLQNYQQDHNENPSSNETAVSNKQTNKDHLQHESHEKDSGVEIKNLDKGYRRRRSPKIRQRSFRKNSVDENISESAHCVEREARKDNNRYKEYVKAEQHHYNSVKNCEEDSVNTDSYEDEFSKGNDNYFGRHGVRSRIKQSHYDQHTENGTGKRKSTQFMQDAKERPGKLEGMAILQRKEMEPLKSCEKLTDKWNSSDYKPGSDSSKQGTMTSSACDDSMVLMPKVPPGFHVTGPPPGLSSGSIPVQPPPGFHLD